MPLVIQRTAIDTFTVRPFDYQVRRIGDDVTNPMPSFVGSRINKVLVLIIVLAQTAQTVKTIDVVTIEK